MSSFHFLLLIPVFSFFFFNDTATTEIYTLSLHDALPISTEFAQNFFSSRATCAAKRGCLSKTLPAKMNCTHLRSEEHTSELQSPCNLVCRLLLEKKKRYASSLMILMPC